MQEISNVMHASGWNVEFLPDEECVLLRFRSRHDEEIEIIIPEEEAQNFANEVVSAKALSKNLRR